MISALIAFFTTLPALVGGFEAFTKARYDAKVRIVTAQIGGDVDVAKQLVSGIVAQDATRVDFLKTVSQSKFLMWLIGVFAAPWALYQAKVVAWDNIMAMAIYGSYGFTPAITGNVGEWAGMIIGSIFGAGTALGVGSMYFNRRER